MKKKSIALLLALTMCLSILSACGGNSSQNTGEPTSSDSIPSTTEQQSDEKEEQPTQPPEETEEPTQEPEESAEPTQEPEAPAESQPAVPAEMTYTFDPATGTLVCSGGGEITKDESDEWIDVIKNALFETNSVVCKNEVKKVVIEDGVTAIGKEAFYECRNLTEVVILDSVVSIGNRAFFATDLTSIQLPDSVVSIGIEAFMGTNLTSIRLPDSVTEIGRSAFENCYNLSSVQLSSQLTEISPFLFKSCNNLTSIQIPDSVVSIGSEAFMGTGLTGVTIPDSVVSIGTTPFHSCPLKELTIPASVTEWSGGICDGARTVNYNTGEYVDELREVTFLCEATMDNVNHLVGDLVDRSVTIHAPAGSVIEGYINRKIESGNAKCTFEPIN